MSANRVSIILPTYNREREIGRSITSVLKQTHSGFELVIVDDGSTDGTADIVRGFDDTRIRFIRLPANRGQSVARNAGIRSARYDLLAFQDSDDEWHPDKLARQLEVMHGHRDTPVVVYCDMNRIWRSGERSYHRSPTIENGRILDPDKNQYMVYGLGIQATVLPKTIVETVGGFDERLRCLEDLELFIRISKRFAFVHIPEPLVNNYETIGVTSNRQNSLRARRAILFRYLPRVAAESPAFVYTEAAFLWRKFRRLRRRRIK